MVHTGERERTQTLPAVSEGYTLLRLVKKTCPRLPPHECHPASSQIGPGGVVQLVNLGGRQPGPSGAVPLPCSIGCFPSPGPSGAVPLPRSAAPPHQVPQERDAGSPSPARLLSLTRSTDRNPFHPVGLQFRLLEEPVPPGPEPQLTAGMAAKAMVCPTDVQVIRIRIPLISIDCHAISFVTVLVITSVK